MGLFDKLKEPVLYKESSDARILLEQLKEYLKVAPEELKQQVEQDIKLLSYGISGEENVAFELMNSFMPLIILHDLHIEYQGLSAQIDYLVITTKVNIIIECKNLFGNIEVNNSGDFIRTIEFGGKKKREGIYSPITQNQRHLDLLKKIRQDNQSNIIFKTILNKYFDDFYKSVVVLANPKTVIDMKYSKKEIKDQIIRCDHLIEYIKKLNKDSKNENSSSKQMYDTAELFLSYHTPNTTDYTKKYRVDKVEETITIENNTEVKIEDTPIYQELKQFRYNRSKEENVKPYFIYNNSQMEELIKLMPKSFDKIKSISGFGDVKCTKYGNEILKIIDKYR